MPGILFVCTANLYRSPIAAAFLTRKLQAGGQSRDWKVASAGTWTAPGRHMPAKALAAARAMGVDLSAHRTQQVDDDLLARFDLIVVMEQGQREALRVEFPLMGRKIHLLSELADGLAYDIPDPGRSSQELDEFLGEISGLIERAYPDICRLAQPEELGNPSPRRHVNVTL